MGQKEHESEIGLQNQKEAAMEKTGPAQGAENYVMGSMERGEPKIGNGNPQGTYQIARRIEGKSMEKLKGISSEIQSTDEKKKSSFHAGWFGI